MESLGSLLKRNYGCDGRPRAAASATLTEKRAMKKKGETSLNLLILAILIYLVQGCKRNPRIKVNLSRCKRLLAFLHVYSYSLCLLIADSC